MAYLRRAVCGCAADSHRELRLRESEELRTWPTRLPGAPVHDLTTRRETRQEHTAPTGARQLCWRWSCCWAGQAGSELPGLSDGQPDPGGLAGRGAQSSSHGPLARPDISAPQHLSDNIHSDQPGDLHKAKHLTIQSCTLPPQQACAMPPARTSGKCPACTRRRRAYCGRLGRHRRGHHDGADGAGGRVGPVRKHRRRSHQSQHGRIPARQPRPGPGPRPGGIGHRPPTRGRLGVPLHALAPLPRWQRSAGSSSVPRRSSGRPRR